MSLLSFLIFFCLLSIRSSLSINECTFLFYDVRLVMNSKHKCTLLAIFSNPVNCAIPWDKVESLLVAVGFQIDSSDGLTITVELNGEALNVHRPQPSRDSLRYRIKVVREFLTKLEINP